MAKTYIRSALRFLVILSVLGALLVGSAGTFARAQTAAITTPTPAPGTLHIHDIQGAGHISPYKDRIVRQVPGIATALRSTGFYLQDPNPDSNDATSEGIFVFTTSAPTVAVGDSLLVSGTVTEYRSGGGASANLSITEIGAPIIKLVSHGNSLPAPITIGLGGRILPHKIIEDDATGDAERSGVFDPSSDGLDFYESLEGMRVQVNDAVVVGPTKVFGSGASQNSEVTVLGEDGAGASLRTARGGIIIQPDNFNPERIILNDVMLREGGQSLPLANIGDHFPGSIVGIMDYSFGNYKLQLTEDPAFKGGNLSRAVIADRTRDQLEIATFNVENLSPSDPITKFNTLATIIVTNLKSPDIISLEEIQDNDGPTNDGVVSATTTYTMLAQAVENAGGPAYEYRQIDPQNDHDGGQPGGNIRQGFFFRTDVAGLHFIDRPGGGATITTTLMLGASGPTLSTSPGRIAPNDPAWQNSRKPLAGEFSFNGHHLFVIGNHFVAKLADDPLFGRNQPPTRSSEVQRAQQSQLVHDFVASILAADAHADVVVVGDLNDFEFSPAVVGLKGSPQILYDLIETLPPSQRYTYVYEGNSEMLDHILVSGDLFKNAQVQDDVVHVNSEFATQSSDHEPQVARFTLPAANSITTLSAPTPTLPNGSPLPISGQVIDYSSLLFLGLLLVVAGLIINRVARVGTILFSATPPQCLRARVGKQAGHRLGLRFP